jgi:hypothetical protein
MNSRKIVQTFNGRTEWNIGGAGYFKLLSSASPIDIELYDNESQVLSAPASESGFYLRAGFGRVVITTPSNQTVEWLYAPAEGGSDRLSGSISLEDDDIRGIAFGDTETRGLRSFIGGSEITAVAGQFAIAQLFNPAGSGIVCYLEEQEYTARTAATVFRLCDHNAESLAGFNFQGKSKSSLGANSLARVRYGTLAVITRTNILSLPFAPLNIPQVRQFRPTIRITPGNAFQIEDTVVNQMFNFVFEWREELA